MDPLAKHVASRLNAQPAPRLHPDAELLSAFAENALPEADRGPLLQHLAACSDCRGILFLALPESAEAQKVLTLKPSWFRHRRLTWGAAVAAVAITVFFATERLEHKNQMARRVAPASTTQSETATDIETETGPEKKIAAETPPPEFDQRKAARDAGSNQKIAAVAENEIRPEPQAKHMTGKMRAPLVFDQSGEIHVQAPAQSANSVGAVARRYGSKDKDEKPRENSAAIGAAMEPSASAGKAAGSALATTAKSKSRADEPAETGRPGAVLADAVSAPAPTPPSVNVPASSEVVEVESAAPAVATGLSAGSLSKSKVTKSKAAKLGATGHNFADGLPGWSLSAAGEVQRSLDHGKTWLPAQPVRGVVFRAIASVGERVWAAGNGGALYHSSDSGLTWSRLAVKAGAKDVQGDITEIDFTDATHGHLKTSDGADFATSDAGQTWERE